MESKVQRSWQTGTYLIHLLNCLLHGNQPQEKPEGVSFEALFGLAQFHSVANMAWYGIESLEGMPEDTLTAKWRDLRDRQVIKSFIQQAEYEAVIDTLTGHKIKVLPVKGSQLRPMYPQSDYRTMADLDVLASVDRMEEVRSLLQEMGYRVELFDRGNQDVYYKEPVMNIEIHRSLMPERVSYEQYYSNELVWSRAISSAENPYLYRMTWSDFYIYLMTHFHKHYSGGGSGIRSIMDIHIFLKSHQNDLDEDYVTSELDRIGLNGFRLQAEVVADHWFGESTSHEALNVQPAATIEMEQFILSSGTYGTIDHHVDNGIASEGSRARYVLKRTFLPLSLMKNQYPGLRKLPFLLPLYWGHRLLAGLLLKRARIQTELQLITGSRARSPKADE